MTTTSPGARKLLEWAAESGRGELAFLVATTALMAGGAFFHVSGNETWADRLWTIATVIGLAVSLFSTTMRLWRREVTVDLIALLALAGALIVGEPLAGALIAVMLATGEVLEALAARRAKRDLSRLISRAPRRARLRRGDHVEEVDLPAVTRGDLLIVGSGEVVPVDGRLVGPGVFDESALTGEPLPVERAKGDEVRSGVVNTGAPVELIATASAADSTYADIVRMVEHAQADTAPFVRTADRFAMVFVPLTLALAGAAWLISGDSVRAVAVLVVATPCPLILAAPIAIMSGLSRCSRAGVVVKGGGVLEQIGNGKVMLFDKTGTLTVGRPTVVDAVVAGDTTDPERLLQLAASLDQVSPHVLAGAIVAHAQRQGVALTLPTDVREATGYGLEGRVGAHRVRVGKASWIIADSAPLWVRQVRRRAALDGSLTVFVAVDGVPAGAFLLADPIRPDAARMIRQLRAAGIERTVLLTGDRRDVAEAVARLTGIDSVSADRDPREKVAVVAAEAAKGTTVMVGDGVNDAPALAAATIGVALASRGASASSQTADVVLTVDRIGALATAIGIAKRSRNIARQAVVVGMGLSGVAMVVAAAGLLAPAYGALLQEVIDVLAMLIALRALVPGRAEHPRATVEDRRVIAELESEHVRIHAVVEEVRMVADNLSATDPDLTQTWHLLGRLEDELVPHEMAEEQRLYPIIARILGGTDPMGPLSRTHAEIIHQVARLRRLLEEIGDQPPASDDAVELQRLLYGMYAILRLHNAQEEEGAFSITELAVDPQLTGRQVRD